MIVINSEWDAKMFYKEREEARKKINSQWDAQLFYETYGGHGEIGNWGSPAWQKKKEGNAFIYDPLTREWVKAFLPSLNVKLKDSDLGISDKMPSLTQDKLPNGKDPNTDSKTGAEKEYIDIEFNTLVGDVSLIPTKDNLLKIKSGVTINFEGIGKYLSGLYFVSEVKRTINTNEGLTLSATLYKNGFGDTLKTHNVVTNQPNTRLEEVNITENIVNNYLKVGDKVKIVGDNAIYSNAHEGTKIPNWVKQNTYTIDALSEDGQRARLKEIWSWTYIKFLKRE